MTQLTPRFASLFPLLALLLACSSCKESTIEPVLNGSLSGVVLAMETGLPLEGVALSTTPATTSIVTDKSGRFSIAGVPPGSYTLSVAKSGYTKTIVNVAVNENQNTEATILMPKSATVNTPPDLASNPAPADKAVSVPLTATLSWHGSDPDARDSASLRYDVFFYESRTPSPVKILEGAKDTAVTVHDLKYHTVYIWQVVTRDSSGAVTNGPLWSFTTRAFPDNPIVYLAMADGSMEIFSTSLDTSTTVRLTTDGFRESWPRWNNRRDKIAFASDATNEMHIYTMNSDGSNAYRVSWIGVAGNFNTGYGFCWSPDGAAIMYAHYDKLYRISSAGGNLALVAQAPQDRNFRECDWSPTGSRYAALTVGVNPWDTEIYTMDPDGSNMKLLIGGNIAGTLGSPSFSIDGNRIMFTRDVSGFRSSDGRQLDAHIFIMKIDQADTLDVSANKPAGTNDTNPSFSPDGSKIVFTNAPNDRPELGSLWVMDATGGNRRMLRTAGFMPSWR